MIGTRQQWSLYFFILGVGVVNGVILGAFAGWAMVAPAWFGILVGSCVGIINMTIAAIVLGGAEIFFPRTRAGRALDRAPFWVLYAAKFIVYMLILWAVNFTKIGEWAVNDLVLEPYVYKTGLGKQIKPRLKGTLPIELLVGNSVIIIFFFILTIQLSRLVGERSLQDIALGRYHRPRAEERFFLFIDIVGSTSLAERIGPGSVHRFLDRVFQITSDPIDDYRGEVYQYVGDEIVVTWTEADGSRDGAPLACYFAIQRALDSASADFQRDFGIAPKLRAALHAGPVISGEVGGSRRAIVFHGDVMNTTSRIENATRDMDRPFLVSEDAIRRMKSADTYALVDLGPQRLRGRDAPMRLYSVASDAGSANKGTKI